jgi:putative ABC transport system ATP-binding protein
MDESLIRFIWRHTRREQLWVLAVVLVSLIPYYLAFDLPKQIVNGPIQGEGFPTPDATRTFLRIAFDLPRLGQVVLFDGVTLDRVQTLMALSATFLLLVIVNGQFKLYINTYKGRMGERLLRRVRYELIDRILRFPPQQFRRIKPAEAASMIKDEVEPLGGFTGDAFVQPVMLAGQALMAMAFICVQNLWLGAVAGGIAAIQIAIIPRMRRRLIRLGRERQLTARELSGRIGELMEGISTIHALDTTNWERADISARLGRIFRIRYELYQWKFMVKFLNNFLAQITPFIFYSFGGYLTIRGDLDVGQLVAVINAYKDLPGPLKELIDWDQQRLDVEAKFHQVVEQFSLPDEPGEEAGAGAAEHVPESGAIAAQGLTVVSASGDHLLERLSLTLPLGAHIAMLGSASEGGGCFAQILGGRVTAFDGNLTIAGMPLAALPAAARGRELAYAGPEPVVLEGTLRDNILYGLRRPKRDGGWTIDYEQAGAASPVELELRLMEVLDIVGLAEAVFRFGLTRRLDPDEPTELIARIAELRAGIRAKLAAAGAEDAVEPYDPARYTRNATIGENLLFGVPVDAAFAGKHLASHPLTQQVLDQCGLTGPLVEMGRRIAATMLEIFSDLAPDHVLREQFAFIAAEDFPEYRDILARAEDGETTGDDRSRLLGLALLYVEPRHRLGLLDAALEQRILTARTAFRAQATTSMAGAVAFYEPQLYCTAAPVRDNLLFGLIAQGAALASERVLDAIRDTLSESGLDREIYSWGLEQPAGYGGRLLFPAEKAQLALARSLIKRPRILIMNNALAALGPAEAGALLTRIRAAMVGRTLIVVGREIDEEQRFDVRIAFQGAKLAQRADMRSGTADRVEVPADARPENEELAALRAVPIFANLDVPRLKLLQFTSERTLFDPGDVLFRQGDDSDAAYVLVAGSADVLIDAPGGPVVVSTVGVNSIVGEMGIVTGDPRSATIVAKTPYTALRLRKEVFLALLAEFPDMALSVTRLMVKRLQENLAKLTRHEPEVRKTG